MVRERPLWTGDKKAAPDPRPVEAHKGQPARATPARAAVQVEVDLRVPDDPWPDPPDPVVYHGIAGEIVHTIDPETESDPVAVLLQFLTATGNAMGRYAYFPISYSQHHTNLYCVLVGRTGRGRKGTSWNCVRALFPPEVAGSWLDERQQEGLSSGEGVINAVRDEVRRPRTEKESKGGESGDLVLTEGVADKRLMIVEEEFSSVLRQTGREGNILSTVLRSAWDSGRLRNLTKNSPLRATGTHLSLIGHITREELLKQLTDTDRANGFANRILWAAVRRSKLLPHGGEQPNLLPFHQRLHGIILAASTAGRMGRSGEASALWEQHYGRLSADRPGVLGFVTSRAEAQALRLSCLYALLDQSKTIQIEHLRAALALWDYCDRSARWVFGDTLGDETAETILEALKTAGTAGLSQTDVSNLFGRNKTSKELGKALALLRDSNLAHCDKGAGSRPVTRWKATNSTNSTTSAP